MSEMLTLGPVTSIDGPLPQRRLYTLLDTAEIVPTGDERWGNSGYVDPYPSDVPSVWQPCVEGSETKPDPDTQPDPDLFLSFGVVLPIFCSAGRGGDYNRLRERGIRAFEATESYGVESGFGRGVGTSPSLANQAQGAAILNSGTAVKPSVGFGLLEDYIGENSGRMGMLHTTPKGAALADEANLLERSTGNGARLTTILGTPVAVGAGYVGLAPAGKSAAGTDQAWVFATGPVQVRRSEIIVPGDGMGQVLDRSLNDVTLYVERNYLVTWDTAVAAAVLIDQSGS